MEIAIKRIIMALWFAAGILAITLPAYAGFEPAGGGNGGGSGVGTSTNPFMASYYVSTSTATSTFSGGISASQGIKVPDSIPIYGGSLPLIYENQTDQNVFVGFAGNNTMTGTFNMGFGYTDLSVNATGTENTAIGDRAMQSNIGGYQNTAVGAYALNENIYGINDVALGYDSMWMSNQNASNNVAIGPFTLFQDTIGNNNTAIGYFSQRFNSSGNNNVSLGYAAGANETGSNDFYVNNVIEPDLQSDKQFSLLYGIFSGSASSVTGQQLTVNGNLGVSTTSPWKNLSVSGDESLTGNLFDSSASKGLSGNVLINSLSTGKPTWVATSTLGISASNVRGVLPIANGGTNSTSLGNSTDVAYLAGSSLAGSDNFTHDGLGNTTQGTSLVTDVTHTMTIDNSNDAGVDSVLFDWNPQTATHTGGLFITASGIDGQNIFLGSSASTGGVGINTVIGASDTLNSTLFVNGNATIGGNNSAPASGLYVNGSTIIGTTTSAGKLSVQGASGSSAKFGTCFASKDVGANTYTYWWFKAGVQHLQTTSCGGTSTTTIFYD